MSGKPLLLPEIYSGESQCWSDWIEHFESVAALNKWATEDEKLKWLKVRLAGKARTAFQKLPRNVREEYGECLKALKQRFEPDSKKELYVAELHTRTRRKDEDWATFGDALKVLADKAYSDLEEKARERLALTQYLAHIENPQIAFGVRQKRPETVDAAVTATIELESYLGSTSGAQKGNIATTAAAGPETLAEALKVLNDRLQKLEVLVVNKAESSSAGKPISQGTTQGRGAEKKRPTCWHCGRKGHIARNCWERQSQQSQGNFNPSEARRGEGHVKAQKTMVTVPTLSVSSAISFSVSGMIGACPLELLVDTGATVSLLNVNMWNKIDSTKLSLEQWTGKKLVGVNGAPLLVKGLTRAQVCIEGFEFVGNFVVSGELVVDAILGLDFLQQHNCVIDVGKKLLKFPSVDLSVGLQDAGGCKQVTQFVGVVTMHEITVPAVSEMEIMVKPLCDVGSGTWMIENNPAVSCGVMVARAVMCSNKETFPIRVLNPRDSSIVLQKGVELAKMELIEQDLVQLNAASVGKSSGKESSVDQAELWNLVLGAGDQLDQNEKEMLFSLLMEYKDVFSFRSSDLGHTSLLHHRINTGSKGPIQCPPRRIPQARREDVRRLLREMLDNGIVEPSEGPWSSPIVLAKKKDGTLRFCVDYRKVNTITKRDAYPLPRIDDTLGTLGGSKFFTTMDLASGYWQVEMAPEDRPKTAFSTPEGLYQFKVMPSGLCNAPATFQRLMDRVLGTLKWSSCLVYFDDIIVVGSSFGDHLRHIASVLMKLREAGLKLKPTKCKFFQKQVAFLGHIVSACGIATDPAKTEVIAKWPTPQSRKEVQQFLGLANYYRRFIKNFGTIAKPLHRLTEKNITFQWTDTCQQAFDNLRKCLMTSPILAHPDWSKSFILDTDASDCGIGAVLSQVNSDGSECVIAYASRSLSRQEQRYCVTRRELLAVVEFVKHFREYLLGRRFTLRTDHGSLVWLKNFKEPEGQLARWLERLEEYDFTVVHRQGSLHNNADALSRIPCRQCGRSSHSKGVPEGSALVGVVNSLPFQTYTAEQMRQFQSVDPIIGPVYNAVSLGELPSSEELNTWGRESKWLLQQWDSLVLDKGLLWRKDLEDANKSQFILPYVLHDEVLKDLHEGAAGGHLGKGKMLGRLKERLYWPGCGEDVEEWCKRCDICARRKSTAPKRRAGLQTLRAGYPMQTVCVDIMGPLPETNRGSKYVLVAADCFTKWVEVYGIPNQEALTVAVKLVDEMFCRFSPPEQIHSDQGRQFESELIKEICKLLQIKKSHTTPYRPQGNGMVERFNRTLLDMLATAVGDNPADWENYIHKLCFAYNTSVHSSTGYSPFFLMFGRQAAIPVDLMYPLRREEEDKELPDFVQELKKRLQDAYASVRVHCQSTHLRQKAIYDRKAHGEQLKEGDLVWLFLPAVPRGQCRKLFHPWTGPYTVVKKMGSCTYKIKNQRGGRYQIVHFDRLKPCMKQSTEADVHPTPVERSKRAVVPQQTRVDANSRENDEDLLLSDDDVEEGEHEDLPVDIPAGRSCSRRSSWRAAPTACCTRST